MEIKDKTAIIKTLDDVLNRQVTSQEIRLAMDSKLIKSWLKSQQQSDNNIRKALQTFSYGSMLLHEFARGRLGIDNKYEPGTNMFNNSWEILSDILEFAKEKGLDSAIAEKYDLHNGSEDVKLIMEHPDSIYSEEELAAIEKVLPAKVFDDFKAVVRSFSEAKEIQAEEERIRKFHNGEPLTKAFVLYNIATRRLYSEHVGDERWFRVSYSLTTPDNARRWNHQFIQDPDNFQLLEGESINKEYHLKGSVAKSLMHMIATSPITERIPLLESKNHISQERDTSKATVRNNEVQPPKGWAAILSSHNDKKSSVSTYYPESVAVGKNSAPAPQADTEQALHDNFEELMKEQGKQDFNKGLHK